MQGTAFKSLVLVVALGVPSFAVAQDYQVRHDRKLEKMIMAATAAKVGNIRGGLRSEWREPSMLDQLANMSALELSLVQVRRIDAVDEAAAIAETDSVTGSSFAYIPDRAGIFAVTDVHPSRASSVGWDG